MTTDELELKIAEIRASQERTEAIVRSLANLVVANSMLVEHIAKAVREGHIKN